MKGLFKYQVITSVACLFALRSPAQFYPTGSATWCTADQFAQFNFHKPELADTVIQGETYQRVFEFYNDTETGQWPTYWTIDRTHYIRSANDGKGFMYIPDSLNEYLIGDLSAALGDTVRDVMIWRVGELLLPYLYDVVVDSIVEVTYLDVSVTRHFLHEVNYWNSSSSDFVPQKFFWQRGMGTSYGLVLNIEGGLSQYNHFCAMTGDSTVFSWYGVTELPPWGFPPGGPPCCRLWNVSLDENAASRKQLASPNPSPGHFRLSGTPHPTDVVVFDPQGRLVLRTRGQEIDLSGHAPGLYTALVQNSACRQAVKLVVER
ncbi:MAG: T9SS type A sorting domain-containing protein [Flavobacteriales bacterium]|nr:T9SS type A sorting domain-containing protein [Flavobacteriales bacterium]